MDEIAKSSPAKHRPKHIFWSTGLYFTPFAFALVLLKWGSIFPTWSIVLFCLAVLAIFVMSAWLHIKDLGFNRSFHDHPVLYAIGTALCASLMVGTVTYLAMRPQKNTISSPAAATPVRQQAAANLVIPLATSTNPPPRRQEPATRKRSNSQPPPEPTPTIPPITAGIIDQSGDGCQQKIVGGSNNTNYCAPTPARTTFAEETVSDPKLKPGLKRMYVRISVDKPIITPTFTIFLSGNCFTAEFRVGDPSPTGYDYPPEGAATIGPWVVETVTAPSPVIASDHLILVLSCDAGAHVTGIKEGR